MTSRTLSNNLSARLITHATNQSYAIPAICIYTLSGITAVVRAANAAKSPAMILLFPSSSPLYEPAPTSSTSTRSSKPDPPPSHLVAQAAHTAALSSRVPISVHLDHATSPSYIKSAADSGLYDSIMLDFSHHPPAENLALTKEWTEYCHERGIVVEAECGRIEGGEDGIQATSEEMEGLMTNVEEARQFQAVGVDWLAPSFGNVHGKYGAQGPKLDFARLKSIRDAVGGEKGMRLVLHGTDGFDEELYKQCVAAGIAKANINRNVNDRLLQRWREGENGVVGTIEEGIEAMQEEVEKMMRWVGSKGMADGDGSRLRGET